MLTARHLSYLLVLEPSSSSSVARLSALSYTTKVSVNYLSSDWSVESAQRNNYSAPCHGSDKILYRDLIRTIDRLTWQSYHRSLESTHWFDGSFFMYYLIEDVNIAVTHLVYSTYRSASLIDVPIMCRFTSMFDWTTLICSLRRSGMTC
jgi:hypothetical protein